VRVSAWSLLQLLLKVRTPPVRQAFMADGSLHQRQAETLGHLGARIGWYMHQAFGLLRLIGVESIHDIVVLSSIGTERYMW